MPRFAANLSMLFVDAPLLDRFDRAAQAGFTAVELQFPYEAPAADVAARLKLAGLSMVLHNLPAGNWAAGDRGMATDPNRVGEFQAGVEKAIGYARQLGVGQLNCLAGIPPASVSASQAHATLVANLRFAAAELGRHGIKLLIEAINTRDVPGFFVNGTEQTMRLMDEVGASNVFMQYDAYHMQRMEGELVNTIEKNLARIAHIQIADNPGRNEPGTGEIHHGNLFRHLDRMGYAGWVGCEYKPADAGPRGTEAGLGWMKAVAA
jgi:hydroxypyruvate isomerase